MYMSMFFENMSGKGENAGTMITVRIFLFSTDVLYPIEY